MADLTFVIQINIHVNVCGNSLFYQTEQFKVGSDNHGNTQNKSYCIQVYRNMLDYSDSITHFPTNLPNIGSGRKAMRPVSGLCAFSLMLFNVRLTPIKPLFVHAVI
jgi:hypothetical protein